MKLEEFLCENLKSLGDVKAKKMFGTYNINIDGINLGVICVDKWYLKRTVSGDKFIEENHIDIQKGIKEESYIISDFSDMNIIIELAKITLYELKSKVK